MSVRDLIRKQMRLRHGQKKTGLKINLYTPAEVRGVGRALEEWQEAPVNARPLLECVMVADSYLMTHLGRPSTRLESESERAWGLDLMVNLVAAVHEERRISFDPAVQPYLVGDFPDGATSSLDRALLAAERMTEAGADLVKVEIASQETLDVIEYLVKAGFAVMAHIGYAPQKGVNRRYGDTLADAIELIDTARQARDVGADALVLERVSEPINEILSAPNPKGLQIYSIFSGRTRTGGQSLNVWDSVFIPDFKTEFFPPTAELPRSAYPEKYTEDRVAAKIGELIQLTLDGVFPKSPVSKLPQDARRALQMIDPWSNFKALTFDAGALIPDEMLVMEA